MRGRFFRSDGLQTTESGGNPGLLREPVAGGAGAPSPWEWAIFTDPGCDDPAHRDGVWEAIFEAEALGPDEDWRVLACGCRLRWGRY